MEGREKQKVVITYKFSMGYYIFNSGHKAQKFAFQPLKQLTIRIILFTSIHPKKFSILIQGGHGE